jgi:hypothetical protein
MRPLARDNTSETAIPPGVAVRIAGPLRSHHAECFKQADELNVVVNDTDRTNTMERFTLPPVKPVMAVARSTLKDDLLKPACWGLAIARAQAQQLLAQQDSRRIARRLVEALSTNDRELRVRAADVARRITEKDDAFLIAHAAELALILSDIPISESRTRWHLGLVVARSARTPPHIRLAAETLWQLSEDKSNVVRSSAVEGLGLLSRRDPALRSSVEPFLHQALVTGTPAMRVRARNALCWLQSSHQKSTRKLSGRRKNHLG